MKERNNDRIVDVSCTSEWFHMVVKDCNNDRIVDVSCTSEWFHMVVKDRIYK